MFEFFFEISGSQNGANIECSWVADVEVVVADVELFGSQNGAFWFPKWRILVQNNLQKTKFSGLKFSIIKLL